MAATEPADAPRPPPTVFLSYASDDRPAAQVIRDALPALGLEVWYDESDLNGGDAWDQKIRRQIRECDFFMPVISARTEARHEGYFRREWRLAVERTLDMADDHTFLLPIVIDDTSQAGARVPEKFLTVQWLRLPGGQPTAAFEALCRRLVTGEQATVPAPQLSKRALEPAARTLPPPLVREYPEFPREEAGQKIRFWAHVGGWAIQSAWIFFNRFPKWVRTLVYVWLFIAVLARACSSPDDRSAERHSDKISPAAAKKLKEISANYQGSSNKADIAKLATQIAGAFSDEGGGAGPTAQSPILAIPFSAPSDDPDAKRLADSIFAQVYGRVAISHHGKVGLTDEPLPSLDPGVAVERGRANHSTYVLYGAIDRRSATQSFTVKIVTVKDGAIVWSQSYPVTGADAAKIAAEVDSKVPALEED